MQLFSADAKIFSKQKKNIGRNPIVDCERNGERQKKIEQRGKEKKRIEQKRIEKKEYEMKFQLENGEKKSLYELQVQLENVNKSSFKNWKKFQLDNGRIKNWKDSPVRK